MDEYSGTSNSSKYTGIIKVACAYMSGTMLSFDGRPGCWYANRGAATANSPVGEESLRADGS